MPDKTRTWKVPVDDSNVRGISSGIWTRATTAQRDVARELIRSGVTVPLVNEILVEQISIIDQQLKVNPDENDPNPLSPIHRPGSR